MYKLNPEEKATMVMAYTASSLIRGEVVTRENARVSVWLRMDGTPDFLAFHNVNLINVSSGQARPAAYSEMMTPAASLIGFHIAPPASDPLDYDVQESNRTNIPISVLMGAFIVKGHIRIPAQSNVATKLSTARMQWMSIYEAQISSPQIPQMPAIQVPMLIVRPPGVSFVLAE